MSEEVVGKYHQSHGSYMAVSSLSAVRPKLNQGRKRKRVVVDSDDEDEKVNAPKRITPPKRATDSLSPSETASSRPARLSLEITLRKITQTSLRPNLTRMNAAVHSLTKYRDVQRTTLPTNEQNLRQPDLIDLTTSQSADISSSREGTPASIKGASLSYPDETQISAQIPQETSAAFALCAVEKNEPLFLPDLDKRGENEHAENYMTMPSDDEFGSS